MTPDPEYALRSRPPAQALRWVEESVGRGASVTSVRRLTGGSSTTMHAVTVACESGDLRLVLRRFVREDWLAREPDIPRREAAALRTFWPEAVPAPRLVAVDEDGRAAGVPSVLMTRLPGRPEMVPRDMDSWLQQLAGALSAIHAVTPTTEELPWQYVPYNDPASLAVPAWTKRRREWRAPIDTVNGTRPEADEHLIHRDYHPANVLWSRGKVSGVVDWVNACRGPAGVDIGHCRLNLAVLYGVETADRFLDYCRPWARYDPYWDLITAIEVLPDAMVFEGYVDLGLEPTTAVARTRVDEYVASLIARL